MIDLSAITSRAKNGSWKVPHHSEMIAKDCLDLVAEVERLVGIIRKYQDDIAEHMVDCHLSEMESEGPNP